MKKLLSIFMVAIMLLPMIASSVMAFEDTEFSIVSQPDATNPTVVTNSDDSVAKYVWHYIELTDTYRALPNIVPSNGIY